MLSHDELNADDVQNLLLDHAERPRNRGRLADATHAAARRNPLCGDEVAVAVRAEDGSATAIRWEGRGCVLCRASASLLCETLEERPIADLADLPDQAAIDLLGLPLSPAKRLCAALPLIALRAALRDHKRSRPGD